MYRRLVDLHGEEVTLSRGATAATVTARVTGLSSDELISGIDQRNRKVILLAEDLEAEGWPDRPKLNDRLTVRGRTMTVDMVDDDTRRVAGTLIAYELTVIGG